ncbi:MAG: FHA domain-containing protein, partial [Trebonia sp.]
DGWVLTDLGSTNGTRVNGWLVRDRVTVQAGDLVRFGETEYTFSDGAGAGAPGAAPGAPDGTPGADASGAGEPG